MRRELATSARAARITRYKKERPWRCLVIVEGRRCIRPRGHADACRSWFERVDGDAAGVIPPCQ